MWCVRLKLAPTTGLTRMALNEQKTGRKRAALLAHTTWGAVILLEPIQIQMAYHHIMLATNAFCGPGPRPDGELV